MEKTYLPAALLVAQSNQVLAIIGADHTFPIRISNRERLSVIESLILGGSVEEAYQRFTNARTATPPSTFTSEINTLIQGRNPVAVHVSHNKLIMKGAAGNEVELTEHSRQFCGVLAHCFKSCDFEDNIEPIASLEHFAITIKQLTTFGLVAPVTGSLDWGDFRRLAPLCSDFGASRGTPVDRVYLSQFIELIRDRVTGRALEIGGSSDNKDTYRFHNCSEYHGMEMQAGPGISYVGGAHNSELVEAESFDSILLFNVLEHCHQPQTIINNIHSWLKPGGSCFLMVPSAQRVHDYPADYWRPLPDGVKYLFRDFKEAQLSVYGNPTTVMAVMMGVAAEELSAQDLAFNHPEYPVATCIVATRK